MKKALSYLLLVSYLVVLVKPVLPYVSDFMAHAFWKYKHIATVHKEDGKTHIHFELKQAAKEDGNNKNAPVSKTETQVSPHIIAIVGYNFGLADMAYNHFPLNVFYVPSLALACNYPPPKA